MYKLPERRGGGGGGGEVIWAMPERKHSFLHEVFPKPCIISHFKIATAFDTKVGMTLRSFSLKGEDDLIGR